MLLFGLTLDYNELKNRRINFWIIILIWFCSSMHMQLLAQYGSTTKSIKIKRDHLFIKAAFDETEYKVIAFDKYGNPHEKAIKSFCIIYKENKSTYQTVVIGNTFPNKIITFLTQKKKNATKICLTQVKAEDTEGHIEDLPDLCDIVIFPTCKKLQRNK